MPPAVPSLAAAVALALLMLLPGCMEGGPRAAPASLRFEGVAFDVATTPDEPNEPRSPLRVGWGRDVLGIEAQAEADLARRTVVLDGEAFTSSGLAWVRHERPDVGRSLSNRLLLWDLPRLLADPRLEVATRAEGGLENTTARGRLELNGAPVDVSLWVRSRGGVPLDAWLASPQGRESPFRFLPGAALSFPLERPAASRPAAEVEAKDTQAHPGHVQLIQLVSSYATRRAGLLPDRVDKDTLQLELLASGKPWPVNPYDGEELRHGRASGHFTWTKCGPTDGTYVGHGWDSVLVSQGYGRGCSM